MIAEMYLAHGFKGRTAIREWELGVEERTGISLINPFYDIERGDVSAIDRGEQARYAEDPIVLVKRDLVAIGECYGIVAILDGNERWGTPMEIVYASEMCKLIVIVCTTGHHEHPWLKFHADHIFTSLEDCEEFLGVHETD